METLYQLAIGLVQVAAASLGPALIAYAVPEMMKLTALVDTENRRNVLRAASVALALLGTAGQKVAEGTFSATDAQSLAVTALTASTATLVAYLTHKLTKTVRGQ